MLLNKFRVISKFPHQIFKLRVCKIRGFAQIEMNTDEEMESYQKRGSFNRVVDQRASIEKIDEIMRTIDIPKRELTISYCRSSGPGGQHVNKTDSKAVIKFNVHLSNIITAATKRTLIKNYANRINKEGELVVSNQDTREQPMNLQRAIQALKKIIAESYTEEQVQQVKMREEEESSRINRLSSKKKRGDVKKTRSGNNDGW